ncbi:MAG TPA: MbcA/ParS/Xre antitoxin family protein [Usitatibacter sp.]|nr:MbcA/ParS/Xre antitoxin family protein [Usitatibacter sp.]
MTVPARQPQAQPRPVDLDTREAGQALLRTYFAIAEAWRLSPREAMTLLGLRSRSTYHVWKDGKSGALPRDTVERISYVLGIYKALQMLLPSDEAADAWIRKPNAAPLFGGRSALDRLLSGNVADLYEVRRYLDAQRG